jgi:hypothetical protein
MWLKPNVRLRLKNVYRIDISITEMKIVQASFKVV